MYPHIDVHLRSSTRLVGPESYVETQYLRNRYSARRDSTIAARMVLPICG